MQTAYCREHLLQPITSASVDRVNKFVPALFVRVKLACGDTTVIVMSRKNFGDV